MRTRLSTVVVIAAAVVSLTAQGRQDPPDPQAPAAQPPVFRAESNFIRVDMFATRDGQFVTDLRADEVEVFEDGVRQRVDTFEYVRIGGSSGETTGAGDEISDEDSRSRVFVVFMDTYTTQLENERALRLSLVRFLDRLLGPNDLVALMTPEMRATDVTLGRRSTVISDVANDERWIRREPGERQDLKEFGWENCYPSRGPFSSRAAEMKARRRAKLTIESLRDLVTHLRDMREERKAVLLVTAGWPFIGDTVLQTASRTETDACRHDRESLLRTDYDGMLEDLARAANRSNVSFYPVNSRHRLLTQQIQPRFRNGVAINPAMVRQRDRHIFLASHEHLDTLAEETDGIAEDNVTDLDRITERIVADTSAYYLLGYQSTNTRADGRFRSITVKVRRDGVRVRSRPGYGGEEPPDEDAGAPVSRAPIVDSRVLLALETVERFDVAAPMWLRSATWGASDEGSGGAFLFTGEIGTLRDQRAWSAGVTAHVEVLSADKTQVLERSFDLKSTDNVFALRVPDEGHLAPGDYAVRVRLSPAGQERTAVHDAVRVTLGAGGSGSGSSVLWRRGPSSRLEYTRTADPRFRRNERLRVEVPTASGSAPSARILDRLGHPIQIPAQVTVRRDASGEFDWIVIDAPVVGLAPGDYAIEVMQDGVEQVTAFRIVP